LRRGKALVEDAVMSLDLFDVAIFRVWKVFGRIVQEVNRLPRKWRQAGRDEFQPGEGRGARRLGRGEELVVLLGEVNQNRV